MQKSNLTDFELIEYYGGCANVARMLGFAKKSGTQRVYGWIRRGSIPASIKLKHPNLFLRKIKFKKATDSSLPA